MKPLTDEEIEKLPYPVFDILKPHAQIYDMSKRYNARVGDNRTPLPIRWMMGREPKNLEGMHVGIAGHVGHGHYDEEKEEIVMDPDADPVQWEDDGAGTRPGGFTVLRIPDKVFTKDGMFFGHIYLKNSDEVVESSIDVWFKVLAGVFTFGAAAKYFISDYQKALDQFKTAWKEALADFNEKSESETKANQDAATKTRAGLEELTDAMANYKSQVDALIEKSKQAGIFTQAEADAFEKAIYQMLNRHYPTVATMVADSSLKEGAFTNVAGHYSVGDGGAANYIIVNEKPATHYEQLQNGLYAKLIITDYVTPEQYGAKGDGVNDDTQAVQSALMSNNLVEFPVGKSYHTTSTITITQVVNLNGNFSPIVYDGTDTAISFDAKLMREQHKRDFGIINNLKIKAPKADIALNWNGGIKTYVNNLKIYNFGHIAINIQYPGYETTFDHVWLIGKGGAETIGIAGNASDMNFGSLYGINVQTYMQMKGGAIHVEYLHPWCANVDTEDNPAIADDTYQAWFKKTCIIDYCNDVGAAHTRVEYIYADTYFNVVVWNTKNKYNSIGTVKTLGITSSFNRYDPDNEYNKYLYYLEIDRLDSGQPDLICNNLGFYPEIKELNGQTTHKVIETSVNGTTVPIVEGRITQYSFTADGKTPEYTNIVNVEALPMACNNKDWGAVLAYRSGQKINNTVSYLTTGLPNETTNIFTFYLRPLPVRIGQEFKYMVDDITKQY